MRKRQKDIEGEETWLRTRDSERLSDKQRGDGEINKHTLMKRNIEGKTDPMRRSAIHPRHLQGVEAERKENSTRCFVEPIFPTTSMSVRDRSIMKLPPVEIASIALVF